MTVIQGGPKPVVAVLPTEALGRLEFRRKEEFTPKTVPEGEAAARYTADKQAARDTPRGKTVDIKA
ncbi:MAG: hypothetical protein DI585_00875 [Pseudomonas fluorescens]|nr:MAG: hypothetical protein DI585_00875 [Pseudomonas fluorescens]